MELDSPSQLQRQQRQRTYTSFTPAQSTGSSTSPSPPSSRQSYRRDPYRDTASHNNMSRYCNRGKIPTQIQSRPVYVPPGWRDQAVLKFRVINLSKVVSTFDFYRTFSQYGIIRLIDIDRQSSGVAYIHYSPPPMEPFWERAGGLQITENGPISRLQHMNYQTKMVPSPVDQTRTLPDLMAINSESLSFGVMTNDSTMTVMRKILATPNAPVSISVNLHSKPQIELRFSIPMQTKTQAYRIDILLAQMQNIQTQNLDADQIALSFSLETPPMFHDRCGTEESISEDAKYVSGVSKWKEYTSYNRLTDIDKKMDSIWQTPVSLHRPNAYIDPGRWLTYRFVLPRGAHQSMQFNLVRTVLEDHNVHMEPVQHLSVQEPAATMEWPHPSLQANSTQRPLSLSDLEHLHDDTPHLSFEVAYQLEVCLSHNRLSEHKFSREFMSCLAKHPDSIVILENLAESKRRFHDPMAIFDPESNLMTNRKSSLARGCIRVLSINVTPTTVYVNTPTVEISNRVMRRFSDHADRFIRVRFQDEDFYGRVRAQRDDSYNQIYLRVKRALTRGIDIAERHYDFLGYGNSQFREHGAYFFAPLQSLSADAIRGWMGWFDDIRIVAKYASRIGQCFSTTRAITSIGLRPSVQTIPDVERNGYCFTDGVGKISPFLAHMIGEDYGLGSDYPSLIQFRMGGCKGVLAVDPTLTGTSVHIRPSQQKFKTDYSGLEVCGMATFKSSYLNQQMILVLTALGVPDHVLLDRSRHMIAEMDKAMTDPVVATRMLQSNVDLNQVTLKMTRMIESGLMGDPFVRALLQLWRTWCMKYLREKAKILIEDSAYVFGCVDETASLSTEGQYPEIFLQIPDRDKKGSYQPVLGLCILTRSPTIHPGDVRVVRAVANPLLRHLKNVVVLPQTGQRPLANMCAGGDLDGDEFTVIWDQSLLPTEQDYPPMNYDAPAPKISDGPVTVGNIVEFFIDYMKNDSLGTLANAHQAWADISPDGVKSDKCLELAQKHSEAVDYPKTGVPAMMDDELRARKWPHYMGKPAQQSYHSNKVLGQIYDEVQPASFHAHFEPNLDSRILGAYHLGENVLQAATELKQQYDQDIRRIMAQHGINTEFEVWTAFVMNHNREVKDFSFAQDMGNLMHTLTSKYRDLCLAKVGQDTPTLMVLVAAIYKVTADEATSAFKGKQPLPVYEHEEGEEDVVQQETIAFMSFPWIFAEELGKIANSGQNGIATQPTPFNTFTATEGSELDAMQLQTDLDGEQSTAGAKNDQEMIDSANEFIKRSEADCSNAKTAGKMVLESVSAVLSHAYEEDAYRMDLDDKIIDGLGVQNMTLQDMDIDHEGVDENKDDKYTEGLIDEDMMSEDGAIVETGVKMSAFARLSALLG